MEPEPPELRILQRVSSSIASTLDLEELYRVCLEMLDELFGFRHTLLLLLDDGGDTLTVVAARGYEDPVLGARVPIILTSRADSVRSKIASCGVAALLAHARKSKR